MLRVPVKAGERQVKKGTRVPGSADRGRMRVKRTASSLPLDLAQPRGGPRGPGRKEEARPPFDTAPLLSEKNPLLKEIRKAALNGSLTDDGFAVAESLHLLEEALESGCEIGSVVVAESARSSLAVYAGRLRRTRVSVVADSVFSKLATTQVPQGVLALVKPPMWTFERLLREEKTLLVVLDGVQDPGNAGAILRASEAFGASGALFLKGTVSPYNPKCLRASAGSLFRMPLVASIAEDWFLAAMATHQITLFAATPHASNLVASANLAGPCAVVIGSEGRGVSPTLESHAIRLRIPTSKVESLNAAVAAGVFLYEVASQRAVSRA